MKKKILIIITTIILLAIITLCLPLIKIKTDNKISYISFTDDISKFDEVTCYDDGMSYYEKWDVTITHIDYEKILFFYKFTLGYEEGNLCDYEYYLDEEYITNFIENAEIKYNENKIDIAKLIAGKKAITGNKKYFGNDYENFIEYVLDGDYETLYVFYVDDLLVIQVGYSDEGPKFIAYK